jgi:hypothetical protein
MEGLVMTIPNFDDVFGSRFVNAADLSGAVTVIIEKIDTEDFARPGEAEKRRAILFFRGRKKGLVLNKTNAIAIASSFGKNMKEWIGRGIVLKPEMTLFGGKQTPCIRVYPLEGEGEVNGEPMPTPPRKAAAAKPEPKLKPPEPEPEEIVDDEIPW